ncbi:Oidioi.mRNA.OKI2018_I69.chr1.g595.t1.cds [Oikopleura dioica]|uniref:Oidioi.mRNA.OKI2018_I69.chr1.g595.t1.cds n=1 Tax=Oikopleura dioica TaxID=34765 RepID=A0ABN7SKB9_OIKDI|nr:Oidioi.mRNA.OKI2018_I69.chr1.g595.t1.cds [Oikopleura dioica]
MNTLLIFFAIFQFYSAAKETRQYLEIVETFDGRRVLKRAVRQADFDEEEGSGSVEQKPAVERLDVFVQIEMATTISFSQALIDSESAEYLSKKEELLGQLQDVLERIANIEDEANLLFENIEVDFVEAITQVFRQSTASTMKAIITLPFQMESKEFLSENDKQSFEDQLLETTKMTFTDMLEDGLADKKLISSDPDFNFSSSPGSNRNFWPICAICREKVNGSNSTIGDNNDIGCFQDGSAFAQTCPNENDNCVTIMIAENNYNGEMTYEVERNCTMRTYDESYCYYSTPNEFFQERECSDLCFPDQDGELCNVGLEGVADKFEKKEGGVESCNKCDKYDNDGDISGDICCGRKVDAETSDYPVLCPRYANTACFSTYGAQEEG